MRQLIIHTNDEGGVSITIPTPEYLEIYTIEDVKAKDTPDHSIIINESELPTEDRDFFNAWVLNENNTVTVDIAKARNIQMNKLNYDAAGQARIRSTNTSIGLPNTPSDEEWLALLNSKRTSISNATTTAQLREITLDS
jgi:hypothetical protein